MTTFKIHIHLQRTVSWGGLCSHWPVGRRVSLAKPQRVKTWMMETSSLVMMISNTNSSGLKSTRSRWKKRYCPAHLSFDCCLKVIGRLVSCFFAVPHRWRSKPALQREYSRTVSTKSMLPLFESWRWGKLSAITFWCLKCTTNLNSQSRWGHVAKLFCFHSWWSSFTGLAINGCAARLRALNINCQTKLENSNNHKVMYKIVNGIYCAVWQFCAL